MAFQEDLNASICMFSFFRRGAMQGSFNATLGVASVFVHVVLRPGWGAWRCPPTTTITTSIFSSVISRFLQWHLRPLIIDNYNVRIA